MKYESLKIKDVKILKPEIYRDKRGYFYESFNEKIMNKIIGKKIHFVQDNQSFSKKNVLRGMHFQLTPVAQAKLVRVIFGKIYDVAVDLRNGSKTFGKWVGKILSDVNRNQLWIPEGFAHGFYCLEDSLVQYKTCLLYTSPSPRDRQKSRMPSSA